MRLELPRRRSRRLVSLTPLIDVVFILLLFFLLASSFQRWQGLNLAGTGSAGAADEPPPALLVRIQADGALDLNGEPVGLDELAATLRRQLGRRPDLAVIVEPAATVTLQPLVAVLEQLAAAGIPLLHLQ
ncbi:MAG: biopolymer transporter ExbD [Chromatiaceae bacterium]|nr:MAG: biopolymer transporter ExbD [Chromatiaceae bacterium]